MIEILTKISELTKEQVPVDPVEQKKFAIQLINGLKAELAQYSNQLDKDGLEEHLFKTEILAEITKYSFRFFQLHLSKKHNAKFDRLWETNEETKKAKKVGYETGKETEKKTRKKKAKTTGELFELRGKSAQDRTIISIAKALLSSFKHLPEAEAQAAALQMATSQYEKISGGKK